MRLFVNSQISKYEQIANKAARKYWLGIPEDVADETIGDSLGRRPGEIFYTSEKLLNLRRKIQVIYDSFTNPKIFIDWNADVQKVRNLAEKEGISVAPLSVNERDALQRSIINSYNNWKTAEALARNSNSPSAQGQLVKTYSAYVAQYNLYYTPWLMTREDFPHINFGLINGFDARSVNFMYAHIRGGVAQVFDYDKDFENNAAFVGMYLETLSDALYANTDIHPDKRGVGSAKRREGYDNIVAFYPFTKRATQEETYVNGLVYIRNYLRLIDEIMMFNDPNISRPIDLDRATLPSSPITINLQTVRVQLDDTLFESARQVISEKVYTYLDQKKEYKTLLNAGDDRQYVMEAWRRAPKDPDSMQFKLLTPLDNSIRVNDLTYVTREVAKSVIDTVDFKFGPEVDITPYLRPRNTNVGDYLSKKYLRNVTLKDSNLLSGSAGYTSSQAITYEDQIFRRWYTADFNTSELNMDFTNYENFVLYGSAYNRLNSFYNKLQKIEQLSSQIKGTTVLDQKYAQEKETIIRNFDPYEQYLFYVTSSAYSASVFYVDEGTEYNPTGSWPKMANGTVYPTTSSIVEEWFTTQSAIANRYDEYNENYLVKHLPGHIQEDTQSSEFLVLISMFGHVMDNLKEYIDQFPNIYSKNMDPYKELTMDQVYEVATSFGLDLPNAYSLNTLQQYFASIYGEQGSRSLVAETWKRFLNVMIFLYKSKGTKTALETVLSTYGIRTPMLQIKESAHPTENNYISSEELTYGLKFTSAGTNSIRLPHVSSSVTTNTLTVRFIPTVRQTSSILTGDDKWAVNLMTHPSSSKEKYGRIEIISGSNKTRIASSSYFRLFDTDYTLLALRSQSADFTLIQTDGDQILYYYTASTNIPSTLWNSTLYTYIGGSGSIKSNLNFEGIVDEVRTWSESLPTASIIKQAYDPGAAYGQNYSSSYANLYVNLSFSQVSASVTTSLDNESLYYRETIIPQLSVSGFTTASYTRISRYIKQFLPIVGASIYSNSKIKIAPPPTFSTLFVDESTNTITLKTRTSIKSINDKRYTAGLNIVSFGVSPTDYINQDIIRTIGTEGINVAIGNNRDLKDGKYDYLDKLFKYYLANYYRPINVNEFIDFYSNLAQAPNEIAQWLMPARAKLLSGIVIESPILSRKKLILNRAITIGGSNSRALDAFVSGSDIDFGAYAGNVEINIPAQTTLEGSVSTWFGNLVVSLGVPTSSNQYFESNDVDLTPIGTASAGFGRYAFIDEIEEQSEQPFYNIPPRNDLLDYGVTTYFHKKNGIYEFIVTSPYKKYYLAKLEISPFTAINPQYSKITLLPTSSTTVFSGRYETTTGYKELLVGETEVGLINTANVFSLLGVTGVSGSRVRLYKTKEARDVESEASRSYTTTPSAEAGVLFDAILNGESDVNPPLLIQTINSTIYYRLDNAVNQPLNTEIVFSYFVYQPIDAIPFGYLPRHYKFSRDNTTTLKRRNYLGCKARVVDEVSDPLGRTGRERPFYTTTADYSSIDTIRRVGGAPPTTPRLPSSTTTTRTTSPTTPTARPTATSGTGGTPRLTSFTNSILGRFFGRSER